jgi:hypothetical protein
MHRELNSLLVGGVGSLLPQHQLSENIVRMTACILAPTSECTNLTARLSQSQVCLHVLFFRTSCETARLQWPCPLSWVADQIQVLLS